MNGITNRPPDSRFGHDYDYGRVTAESEVTLVSVPWGNNYADVVEYPSDEELNAYIDGEKTHTMSVRDMTYLTPGAPIRIPVPVNTANVYNYVRVRNPVQPTHGKDTKRDYYFFILDAQRVNSETTELSLQVDVWQTYRRMVRFLRAFVEVGHVGIANSRQHEDQGRKWLTTPEGLDLGAEYEVTRVDNLSLMWDFDVVITAATNLVNPPGTVNNPSLQTSSGGLLQGIPTATTSYAVNLNEFNGYMRAMSGYPWVTQGIIRAVVVPKLSFLGTNTVPVERTNNYPPGPEGSNNSYLRRILHPSGSSFEVDVNFPISAVRKNAMANVGERYSYLHKFKTSPFCFIEVSTGFGDSFTYRPELFPGETAPAKLGFSLIPGSERLELNIRNYNSWHENGVGDRYSAIVSLGNFPTLPVVNNMAISALASSAHGRNQQRAAADWSQQLAMTGSNVGYSNAQLGASTAYTNQRDSMALSKDLQGMQQTTATENQRMAAATGIISGALSGGAGGANGKAMAAGAVGGAAGVAIDAYSNAWQLNNSQKSEQAQLRATLSTTGNIAARNYNTTMGIAEANKGLADYAAQGNYAQSIAAINAQVRDTMLTQPGMSGQYGGEFLRMLQKGFTFEVRTKMIDAGAIRRIGEHWLRYGYRVHAHMRMNDSLLPMTKFAYWKTQETYISRGQVPEIYKQAIRGIMERGVTVWADAAMIGVTDPATNRPKSGVTITNGD